MVLMRLIVLGLLFSATLYAHEDGEIKLNLGGMYVTTSETSVRLAPSGRTGVLIDLEKQLGQEAQSEVFYMDGSYRFNDSNSLSIGYFGINNSGSRSINEDITWTDKDGVEKTIEAGANVSSHFNIRILKMDYGYSFYHNDDVELILTVGLHLTDFDVGINAYGTINGVPTDSLNESDGILAPLPTFGFRGEYTILPKDLFVTYNIDYFFLSYDDYEGSLINSTIGLEYRFTDSLGMGVGYDMTQINVSMDDGKRELEVDSRFSGITTYFTYIF
jgi:hypothetical protein